MVFARNSIGIVISGNDLLIAVTKNRFGKLRLIGRHRVAGFLDMTDDERRKAIKALIKNHHIPTGRVYLAIPRDQGIVRQIELPSEMTQRMSEIVKIQVQTLSPWSLDEIYWDFAQESQRKGKKLTTVTVAMVQRSVLDPWIVFFKSAGVPLSGATLSSLAYAHGAAMLWPTGKGTFILHREEAYTEGVVVNENRVSGLTASSEDGALDTAAFVDRLLSIAKLPSAEGFRFILCGTNLDATAAEENPRLNMEGATPQATADFGAIAAALASFKGTAFSSNLVPSNLRYRESQLRLVPAFVLGLIAICLGLVLLAREPYQSRVYAGQLEAEIEKIAPRVSEVAAQETELNQLSARARAMTASLQSRDHNLEALREIARILPASAFLSNYTYQDGALTVSGFAQSASEIQSLFENSPMFKGAEFTNSVVREATGKDRFTLKMVVEVPQ